MFISRKLVPAMLLIIALPVVAQDDRHKDEHGGLTFHKYTMDAGYGIDDSDESGLKLELDASVGTDEHKLRLQGSGERIEGETESAEIAVLYSLNVSDFWDVQVGVRHDMQPVGLTYLAAGVEGLAPYFFETELHAYLSENGDVSLRLRQQNELLFTQRLVAKPYLEAELYLQDVPELATESGFAVAEAGLQLRYEFTRKFAPYLEVSYTRYFDRGTAIFRKGTADRDILALTTGLRLMF